MSGTPPLAAWERELAADACERIVPAVAAALEEGRSVEEVVAWLSGSLRRLTDAQRSEVASALEELAAHAEGDHPADT